MLKKVSNIMLLLTLFCLNFDFVYGYEYIDSRNEKDVLDKITNVYDAKQLYEDFAGEYEEVDDSMYYATSSSYWWPIGSQETIESNGKTFANGDPAWTTITSSFGYRSDPFSGDKRFHSGIDIASGGPYGVINIIAARDGVVVYPTAGVSNNCVSSGELSSCGGGYGNYVVIQHADGNYTLYGHMYEGSITVVAGESVKQGQVIGKMGSSGKSTGTHLHFEVREGSNSGSSTVNPLNYVSPDTPRKLLSGGELVAWLNSWEGHTTIDGNYYIVQDIGDGVRSVGSGITLENTASIFATYGINVNRYQVGSRIPISVVDQVELEVIGQKRSYIESLLSGHSITLSDTQIEALISQMYNIGNINGFIENYKKYGNTQQLYTNWFYRATMPNTRFEAGLKRRRNAEWTLFHTGKYVYNG